MCADDSSWTYTLIQPVLKDSAVLQGQAQGSKVLVEGGGVVLLPVWSDLEPVTRLAAFQISP